MTKCLDALVHELGVRRIHPCFSCGNFNSFHAAAFVAHAAPERVLAYGENRVASVKWTLHAEEDAIRRLPPRDPRKRCLKVDLVVLRLSRTGCLGESKPCAHCLERLCQLPERGYKLESVHYTTSDRSLVSSSLRKLLEGPLHTSKYYRR